MTMSGKTCLVTGATMGMGKETAAVQLILRLRPGPATGARTPVYLAGAPEVAGTTGGYFVRCRPAEPSHLATDARAA